MSAVLNEGHLGGYLYNGDPATTFPSMWKTLVKDLNIKSVLEIGCGRGFALKEFQKLNCHILGLDGSPSAIRDNLVPDRVKEIDFTRTKVQPQREYDLVYSVEFVEHVEECYKENFLTCFDAGKYILMTFADVGQGGHHHVNCQPASYWIETIEKRGFKFDQKYTNTLKEQAKLDRMQFCPDFDGNHFEHRGLFFKRNDN
jgi:cyclopropane fatty-acyl-phospholipid synthase-like methyltransferase